MTLKTYVTYIPSHSLYRSYFHSCARVLSILFLPRNVNRKNPFTLHFARVFALTAIEIVHTSLIIIEKFSHLLQTHYGKSLRPYKPKH